MKVTAYFTSCSVTVKREREKGTRKGDEGERERGLATHGRSPAEKKRREIWKREGRLVKYIVKRNKKK